MIDSSHNGTNFLHNTNSQFVMSSAFENNTRDNNKRLRAGSVSGRLRTASDLEEWGWIDKTQKGVLKDLLISGNTDLQNALDKFRGGDTSLLQELINQGIFKRHHSIDILDGLDFDFLNVDIKEDFEHDFGDDIDDDTFDVQFHSSQLPSEIGVGISDLNNLLSSEDVDLDDNILSDLNEASFGNEWYDRNFASINFNSSSSSNVHIRKNSLLVGDLKDWGNLEYNVDGVIDQPSNNIFEDDVDLSMYEHVAANLQKSNPSKINKKTSKSNKDDNSSNTSPKLSNSHPKLSKVLATDSLLSPSSLTTNKSTTPVQVKEEKVSAINQTVSLPTVPPPPLPASVLVGIPSSSIATDSAKDVNVTLRLSPCSLNVDSTVTPAVLPNSSPNVSTVQESINSLKMLSNSSSNSSSNTSSSSLTNNSNNFGSSLLNAPTSSTIHTHSIIHQTTYSPASVLLLSTNGLLPTPGIIGPGLDGSENGLTNMLRSPDFIGAYDPDSRRQRIERFIDKRNRRVWTKKVKYDVRKNFADSRLRVKGRFVKKEDEELMRELLTI